MDWGELDYLVVDLPPGTGDASLTLAQAIPLSRTGGGRHPSGRGPVRRLARRWRCSSSSTCPILGVVENMSYFLCPHCEERTDIFGHGGARAMAEENGVPFLGEMPLDPVIRAGGDIGHPVLVTAPESPLAVAFREMGGRVAARVSVLAMGSGEKEPATTAR